MSKRKPSDGMRHGVLQDTFMGPAIFTEGEDLVNDAWEADTPTRQCTLARKALDADLDNIDAYVLLSFSAKTLAERLALLREAVRVGDRLWQPLFDAPEMVWWEMIGTRPFLRALHLLAMALEEAGDIEAAETTYRRLLEINPNDNQGVREQMIARLMANPRIGELRDLLAAYPDDGMLASVMARLWLGLRSKKADVAALVGEVEEWNPHVVRFLVSGVPAGIERDDGWVTAGGEDEAAHYVEQFAATWAGSDAMKRLKAHLEAT